MRLLLWLGLYAGLLFLGFKLILAYTTRVASKVVDSKHRDLEIVLNTGRAPKRWFQISSDDEVEQLTERDRDRALRRLDTLDRYVQRSPLVDSDESRAVVRRKIADVRSYWKEAPVSDIVAL